MRRQVGHGYRVVPVAATGLAELIGSLTSASAIEQLRASLVGSAIPQAKLAAQLNRPSPSMFVTYDVCADGEFRSFKSTRELKLLIQQATRFQCHCM